jgi:hypothetical protein
MLAGMMKTPARFLTLFIAALIVGCGNDKPVDKAAGEYLGPATVHVIARPTRVEGWNFQRPDMSIASDPPIRDLDPSIGQELANVLKDSSTFGQPARLGAFERSVGFRLYREDQSVDVILSFNNDQALIRSGGYTGQPGTSIAGVTGARARLLALAKRAFPDFQGPAK